MGNHAHAKRARSGSDFFSLPLVLLSLRARFLVSFSFLVPVTQVIVVIVIVRKRKLSNPYDYDCDSYDAVYHGAHDFDLRITLNFNAPLNYTKIQRASRWRALDQTNVQIGLFCVVRSEDCEQ